MTKTVEQMLAELDVAVEECIIIPVKNEIAKNESTNTRTIKGESCMRPHYFGG